MTQIDTGRRTGTLEGPRDWRDLGRLLEAPMRDALDRLEPDIRLVCGYHLGYWTADGEPTEEGGKGVRPALALLSARAAGGTWRDGVPAAVACELVHNFSLLHDDVMDGDAERRHRPTAWSAFGTPSAILAGDALLSLANEILAAAPGPTTTWAIRCLNACTRRLIAGQAADLSFESRAEVTPEECLTMASDKTGALLACSASLGAVLLDAPPDLAIGLAAYGEHLGLAFQLVDDLLGIWGSPARTGKPVWSDLRARKKTLPVTAALASTGSAAQRLRELYAGTGELSEAELAETAALVEHAGGRTWTEDRAEKESAAALAVLDGLDLPDDVRHELDELTATLSRRDY
jgi:geranylgeranyl diphosphate synthase type I